MKIKFFKEYKQFIIAAILFSILGTGVTFALPYVPTDQQLDPTCAPGDTDCYVSILAVGNAVTDATAGSIFFAGTSGVLQQDNTNLFWDDTNNRLGIGTTSPDYTLHVIASNGATNIVGERYSNDTTGSVFRGSKARGTPASPSVPLSGDSLLYIDAMGYDGTSFSRGANLLFVADGDFSLTNRGTSVVFSTVANGSTTNIERMRLSSAGNLLLGTTTNSARLHVRGLSGSDIALFSSDENSSNGRLVVQNINTGVSAASKISILNDAGIGLDISTNSSTNTGTQAGITIANYTVFRTGISSNGLIFGTGGSGDPVVFMTGGNERMRIDGSGNVGIGTSSPSQQLELVKDQASANIFMKSYSNSPAIIGYGIGGTLASPTATTNGQVLLRLGGNGYGATSEVVTSKVGVALTASENWTDIANGTQIYFQVTPNGTTNRTSLMLLHNNGNLSLGSSLSDLGKLTVQGLGSTSSTYTAQFHNSTGTNNALVIRDDGFVGFGTATPLKSFDVRVNPDFAISNDSLTADEKRWQFRLTGVSGGSVFALQPRSDDFSNGTTAMSFYREGYNTKAIMFGNNAIAGTTSPFFSIVQPTAPSLYSGNLFSVLDSSLTSFFTVKTDGNVGIGIDSPLFNLHIKGDAGNDSSLVVDTPAVNLDSYVALHENGVEKWKIRNQGDSSDRLRIGSGSNDNVMRIDQDGRITINSVNNGSSYLSLDLNSVHTALEPSTALTVVNTDTTVGNMSGILFSPDMTGNFGSGMYGYFTNRTGGALASDLRFYTTSASVVSERMRITETGLVGIGTGSSVAYKLDILQDSASTYATRIFHDGNATTRWGLLVQSGLDDHTLAGPSTLIAFQDGDGTAVGSITFGSSATAYNTTSDQRMKNLVNEQTISSLNILKDIKIHDFTWKDDTNNNLYTGVFAQELYEVYPFAVTKPVNDEDKWMVDYSKLTPVIIASVQELNTNLTSLDPTKPNSLASMITEFLRSAIVSIQDLTVSRLKVNGDVCVDDVCITKDQFKQLLQSQGGSSNPSPSPQPESEPELTPEPEEEVVTDDEAPIEEESIIEEPLVEEIVDEEESITEA